MQANFPDMNFSILHLLFGTVKGQGLQAGPEIVVGMFGQLCERFIFSFSCTMPSLEVGTVGGGTVLGPQSACLKVMLLCRFHTSVTHKLKALLIWGLLDFWLGASGLGIILT